MHEVSLAIAIAGDGAMVCCLEFGIRPALQNPQRNSCNMFTMRLVLMTVLAQQLAVCLWNTGKAAAVTTAKSPLEAPLRGWSTWNSFQCHINATVINESIAALAASPLFKAGSNYVLIDDYWTVCDERMQHRWQIRVVAWR